MSKLLELLGAKHAAEMHKKFNQDWTNQDWLTHFWEEENHVLPLLYASGFQEAVDAANKIAMEHEKFRAQIKVFGRITNEDMLDAHAALEDDIVLKYLGYKIDPSKYPRPTRGAKVRVLRRAS